MSKVCKMKATRSASDVGGVDQDPPRPPMTSTPLAPPPPNPYPPESRASPSSSALPPRVSRDHAPPSHSFHTDLAEVRTMEKGLLELLSDFKSGKLVAFGSGCSMDQMESIRDQQESLARLHFEMGSNEAALSQEAVDKANRNREQLMNRLEKLSQSIGKLNPNTLT